MVFARFIPDAFFLWCQATSIGHWIRNATWGFAVIETVHIMGLAIVLGAVSLVNLRLLGFVMRNRSATQISSELAIWTWSGLAVMVVTGVALFLSEATRLSISVPFFYKMVFLFFAIAIHLTITWKLSRSGFRIGALGKLMGCLSILLWLCVAFAGRAIAFPFLFHLQ